MGPLRSYTKHTDIPAIAAEIRRLNPQSMEGEVNGVWNSILNWVFDPVNGFVTQPQAMHRQYGGKRGFSDFHTMSVAGGTRRSFLITQCKSAKGEGKDGVWDDGAEQLQRYLGTKHGMRPTAQRPAYGILARVRFFQYDRSTDTIRGSRLSTPLPDGREFYSLEQATDVQTALREILNHH